MACATGSKPAGFRIIRQLGDVLMAVLWKGLLYALSGAVFVWLLIFAAAFVKFHVLGHTPDGILWLAPQHMPWRPALDKSAYIASVSAMIMFALVAAATLIMNLLGWLIIGIFWLLPKHSQH